MRHSWLFAHSALSTGFLLTTSLQPHWGDMRVKHAWNAVPRNWKQLGHPPAETVIDLYIALKPQNENALIDALLEVSDPDHPRYGAHLSKEQVAELVEPHPNTLELINSWLRHHGVPPSFVSTSHGGGWLALTGVPVSQANDLLGASYQHYQHAETKDRALLTLRYALPKVLHEHVQTVAPTTYFGPPSMLRNSPHRHSGGAAAGELVKVLSSRVDDYVNPPILRWRYGTQFYVPGASDATAQNELAIVTYSGQYPSQDDLTTFMNIFRMDGADATFTLDRFGSSVPGVLSFTSSLEIQYTEAIAYPTRIIYYSSARDPSHLAWFDTILDMQYVPRTITTSISDNEQNFEEGFARAMCNLFARLGARGASVLISTGDDAVGNMTGDCRSNDGTNRAVFFPKFPASCPWVTSVGGTESFFGGGVHPDDEIAAPYSSGGFSTIFNRPPYQINAVPTYLQNFPERYNGRYNVDGRGFPDVSAHSENYEFVFNGEGRTLWGTGCSAPTMAAVISLVNDYLLANNRPTLGFLNKWLYSHGFAGFHDITHGGNPGCLTAGFSAMPGWDPVTGLGSPRLPNLLDIFGIVPAPADEA